MDPRDPIELFDQLREYLFRYYDTPFATLDKLVQGERRRLLDRDKVTFSRAVARTQSPNTLRPPGRLRRRASGPGLRTDLVEFARCGLYPPAIVLPFMRIKKRH